VIALLVAGVAALLGGLATFALVLSRCPDRWLRPEPRGDLEQADFFAVFGMGLGRDSQGHETAGKSNEALADWLLANNPRRKPALVQEGVYLALAARERRFPRLQLSTWVVRLPHAPAVYRNTAGAALQCWALAAARGLSRPAVIAHDLQQQRMAWIFDRLFTSERVVVPALPSLPFDAKSVQHWGTRSRRNWLVWELLFARPAIGRHRGGLLLALAALGGAALAAGLAFGLALLFR
jgi:hypothetical protein